MFLWQPLGVVGRLTLIWYVWPRAAAAVWQTASLTIRTEFGGHSLLSRVPNGYAAAHPFEPTVACNPSQSLRGGMAAERTLDGTLQKGGCGRGLRIEPSAPIKYSERAHARDYERSGCALGTSAALWDPSAPAAAAVVGERVPVGGAKNKSCRARPWEVPA